MGKRSRILLAGVLVAMLGCLAWVFLRPQERIFHGKPESFWIASLSDVYSVAETKEWQAFGVDGVPILVKALGIRNGLLDGVYSRFWSKLPVKLKSRLPKPVDSTRIRMGACFALLGMGSEARIAVPALCRALDDRVRGVRMHSLICLNGLLPILGEEEKTKVLPALLKAMQSKDLVMRYQVAIALSYYPDQARNVIPALVNALDDPDENVRNQALLSLGKIKIEPAAATSMVPFFIKCLKNQQATVRAYAATKLGVLGREPGLAVPALIELLGDKDPITAYRATRALGKFGDQAQGAIPALLKASETAVPIVRTGATNALKAIDPGGNFSLNKM